ncbi:MAG: aspartyl protease family protein [Bacteroidales bacterium]|jgi:midasin (ATPase involved in ribosome maturation)|nr:aspartyl protease family protein [Bacteroidales bacterium]MDD3151585.1 aspartyl protease family protein [Bacteroidales bacterium]MDD3914166.1 aspartyl protease family protein [Bacteroidales bacterium]MDD4633701.1 aspartyl protease family protein [Bacteroidales bacterium]
MSKFNIKFYTASNFDDDKGSFIYIKCKINKKSAILLIDTGASRTCFDQGCLKKFFKKKDKITYLHQDIATYGIGEAEIKSNIIVIDNIKLGRLAISGQSVALTDLSGVNSVLEKSINLHIDGVIGNDIFEKYTTIIDYRKRIIRFYENEM